MQKTKSNSKQKILKNTNKLINQYRQNSVDNKIIQRSSNKRFHMNSPLLHAQRNLKLVMKNQLKKQLFEAQFPLKSLPKLFKTVNRNYSTLDRDCVSTIEKSQQFTDYLPNNKQIKTLKNLLINAKESNKAARDRAVNLLGLQIKKIECQINPEETSLQITNMTNFIINHNHFSSVSYFKQKQFQQNLILKHQKSKQKQQSNNNVKQILLHKKKTFSLPSVSKNQYFHYKPPKFNFNLGSESYKIYERRMKLYQQFIFTIQFGHNVYIKNEAKQQQDSNGLYMRNQNKYKIWIGSGNNWMLIKSLIKRRYWWLITHDRNLNQVNFVWTQLKINSIFQKQKPSQLQQKAQDLRKCEQDQQSEQQKRKIIHRTNIKRDRKQMNNLNVQFLHKILNPQDKRIVKKYIQKKIAKEKKVLKPMQFRHKSINKPVIEIQSSKKFLVHNHLENNFFLGNKKAMFYNLKQYYELIHDNVFNYLPLTFHIKNGTNDIQYKRFQMYYNKRAAYIAKQQKEQKSRLKKRKYSDDQSQDDQLSKKFQKLRNIWIVKPGQLSNRGNGITVIDQLKEINNMLNKKQKHHNGTNKTYIVQLYIDRPMLYNNRKFDIRHYMLITNMFGVMRGYWYQQGYIRTASYQFDIFTFDKQIHLTNDAVQKYTDNYGKYEPGNKLSYSEFQRYLDSFYPEKGYNFQAHIIPKMKKLATDAVKSAYLKLSPTHKQNNFQIFGLDFMIDRDFKPWLIQINTNPCLELSCPLLQRIIPVMVQNSFRLSLDVMFPPPGHYPNTTKHLVPDLSLENQKYELIFDSLSQGASVQRLYRDIKIQKLMDEIGAVSDEQQQYEDEGQQLKFDEL